MKTLNRLSDAELKAVKPTGKIRKLQDGGGLYAYVTAAGSVSFRYNYKFNNKSYTLTFGLYPQITLKAARARHLQAQRDISNGVNPAAVKSAAKKGAPDPQKPGDASTFNDVYRQYVASKSLVNSPSHLANMDLRMARHVLPFIGDRPIAEITPHDMLAVLRRIESLGHFETAHKLLAFTGQIFRFGVASLIAPSDPTGALKGALAPVPKAHRAAITEPEDIRRLLAAIDDYHGSPIVKSALRLAPLVFVRPGELRLARWDEFDLPGAEWRIPAARMKMAKPHIVPLARQSLGILDELRPLTGGGPLLFPGFRTAVRPISDATLLNALRSLGFEKTEMTVHGFRAMASTRLNELGYNYDWIERQLAHAERNSIRAAYNHADYLPDRRRMMQEWADYLDSLRS